MRMRAVQKPSDDLLAALHRYKPDIMTLLTGDGAPATTVAETDPATRIGR